jgi:hypothetical protein
MGDSAHTAHHTNPGKKSAPPLFLGDENFFQKSASVVVGVLLFVYYCNTCNTQTTRSPGPRPVLQFRLQCRTTEADF